MTNGNEVTASKSHAVLISELTDTRNRLWMLIAVGKQVAHALPATDRIRLIQEMSEAEKFLGRTPTI